MVAAPLGHPSPADGRLGCSQAQATAEKAPQRSRGSVWGLPRPSSWASTWAHCDPASTNTAPSSLFFPRSQKASMMQNDVALPPAFPRWTHPMQGTVPPPRNVLLTARAPCKRRRRGESGVDFLKSPPWGSRELYADNSAQAAGQIAEKWGQQRAGRTEKQQLIIVVAKCEAESQSHPPTQRASPLISSQD